MRLPWVSRELYERALQEARDWKAIARDATNRDDDSDRRFDALLNKYHALKVQGAVSVPESRAIEAKEPDAVQYAIHEKAAGRHGLKLYLTGWAAQQRQLQVPDDEIVNRIQNWRSNSDDEQADGSS